MDRRLQFTTAMRRLLHISLLLFALHVAAPAAALQHDVLAETQQQYDLASRERSALFERLEALEQQYQGFIRKIEELKNGGALNSIGGRIELQNLLAKSKTLADELDGLQAQLRAVDTKIAGQRTRLVSGLDQRLQALERSLGSAPAKERADIVVELNSLRKRRAAYTEPLPVAPTPRDLSSVMRLADDAAHPAELIAAADELQDTEDQLRRRLAAIEARLSELREARTLSRRARRFSREERFFEETDRDRVIARYERVTSTSADAPSANDSPANDASSEFAGLEGENSWDAPAAAPESAGGRDDASGPTQADHSDPEPPAPTPDPIPVVETTRETIVIDGGTDPSRTVGSLGTQRGGLDGEIDSLEAEHKRLKKQADTLRSRAGELRDRARDM